jgi:predicted secreted protein
MAFKHGKGTIFKLDDSTPTLNDISAYVNNVDFPREVDTPETTTFGNDDRTYIAGLRGATISITGFWDETVDGYLAGIVGQATSSTFEYGPQGGSTGDIKYTGEAFVTNYTQGSPVDGVTTFSLDLQITGAVTRTSF